MDYEFTGEIPEKIEFVYEYHTIYHDSIFIVYEFMTDSEFMPVLMYFFNNYKFIDNKYIKTL